MLAQHNEVIAVDIIPKKVKLINDILSPIKDEYIKLDQFLKFVNLVSSGIEAKMIIKDGQVKVNGEVELRRGKKLHDGDQVEFEGNFYCINAHQ